MADYLNRIIKNGEPARYNLVRPNGTIIEPNVRLVLTSELEQDGTTFAARDANMLLELMNGNPRVNITMEEY